MKATPYEAKLKTRLQYRGQFVTRQAALRAMDDPDKWTVIPKGRIRYVNYQGANDNCWILWDEFGVGLSAEEAAIELEKGYGQDNQSWEVLDTGEK